MISDADIKYLNRCVELAAEALDKGDEPFGSVLVSAAGDILFEDRNRVAGGDHTRHPEFEIARWAANNMTPAERAQAVVYTSGEHCPMCSAAHGWVGLGRIVFASSSKQLSAWLRDMGVPQPPVNTLSIQDVVPDIAVDGPVPELSGQIHQLHKRLHAKK